MTSYPNFVNQLSYAATKICIYTIVSHVPNITLYNRLCCSPGKQVHFVRDLDQIVLNNCSIPLTFCSLIRRNLVMYPRSGCQFSQVLQITIQHFHDQVLILLILIPFTRFSIVYPLLTTTRFSSF